MGKSKTCLTCKDKSSGEIVDNEKIIPKWKEPEGLLPLPLNCNKEYKYNSEEWSSNEEIPNIKGFEKKKKQ